MKYVRAFFTCLALLLTSACAQTGVFVANFPTHFDNIDIIQDVIFDATTQQTLDIYKPQISDGRKLPVIIFFYGGRWETGQKEDYRFVGAALAQRGYVVVIPDYRKYPHIRFPVFVEDAAKAVAWTHDTIEQYGGLSNEIYLLGHSSGAHIASLLVTDKHYLKNLNQSDDTIKAFAGLAGPYSFTPDAPDLEDMFGPPSNYSNMQATTFVDGHEAPMLLLWGEKDTIVGRFNLDNLTKAVRAKGGVVETKTYTDIDHVWIVGSMSWLGYNKAPVIDDIDTFFAAHRPK